MYQFCLPRERHWKEEPSNTLIRSTGPGIGETARATVGFVDGYSEDGTPYEGITVTRHSLFCPLWRMVSTGLCSRSGELGKGYSVWMAR